MEINKRNTKIGLFFIVAFAILFIGINYLKGQDVFFAGNRYYAYYGDVDGLADAAPVMYKGYKVGAVRAIDICPENDIDKRFKVTIALDYSLDLPIDTKAEIYSTDILGGKGIDLVWGKSEEFAESRSTLASSVKLGMTDQIMPLKDKAEMLVGSVDSTLYNINNLIGGKNGEYLSEAIKALEASMRNIEVITRNIEKATSSNGALGSSIKSLDTLMSSLARQSENIDVTMNSVAKFSESLSKSPVDSLVASMNNAMAALGEIVSDMDNAEGSIGKFLNDSKLYDKLAESSENLNRLLVDVRLNPSRYVKISAMNFGKSVYFSDAGSGMAMVGKVYTVSLVSSEVPLDFPVEIEGNKVIEYSKGKKYEYLVGQFREKSEAQSLLLKLQSTYKDACIRAFDSGREVSAD